jgi:hypothetical protein
MCKYVLLAIYFLVLGFCIGALVGTPVGHHEACASIQAEWRDKKCVRVVVEEVK